MLQEKPMVDIGRICSLLLEDQQSSVFHFNFSLIIIIIFFAYFYLVFEVHQSHIFLGTIVTRIDTSYFNVVWKCSRSLQHCAGRPGWLFAPQTRA